MVVPREAALSFPAAFEHWAVQEFLLVHRIVMSNHVGLAGKWFVGPAD